jgi:carboxyl-terminal processing protease
MSNLYSVLHWLIFWREIKVTMQKSFFHRKVIGRIFINLLLVFIMILSTSTSVWASTNEVLPEIRSLLQDKYADPVSQEVLNAPTIDEMLKRLGDPHTSYFSPQEYKDFVGSINMSFVGIGIHIVMLSEGVKIDSVIPGSPAEEIGLKPGDIIISADGQSLAGLSSDQAVNLLRGAEGSTVQITVKQGSGTEDLKVTRRAVAEPTVTGSVLDGHIGYLELKSFGSNTPYEFATTAVKLNNQSVDSWIVDLRNNGGGYLSSAIAIAGFFIGPDVAVQVKDRSGVLHLYQAPEQPFTLNKPIIFLTNENSASASEVLTGAVKDYQKAKIVGTTTYGKGTVQSMFDLSNGGVLKMTIEHFYSAFGNKINKVGITPDVEIQHADSLKAAELMLSDKSVTLAQARTPDFWEAWRELSKTKSTDVKSEPYTLYYPDYKKVSELSSVPLDKTFTVHFDGPVDWHSVNDTSVQLINSTSGERIPTSYKVLGPSDVQLIPEKSLTSDSTYWLVVNPKVLDTSGKVLGQGTVTVIHTIPGAGTDGKATVQSFIKSPIVGESKIPSPGDPDYGWAIWDSTKK